ncbi:MAG TPA: class I SAM-dependent methyltransferase [Gammaproteobacteria bacterium]|nr:class I SAM-dependent methyltransferase [Gammaproteobacteria bacterium]
MQEKNGSNTAPPLNGDYWRGAGGDRWVMNLESLERGIEALGSSLIDAADPRPGERVLDIGCGGAMTTISLARAIAPHGRVTGIDISPQILAVARQRTGGVHNIDLLLGDVTITDLGDPFDLLFSRFGVMFFEKPALAFRRLHGCLKPGGRLAFLCWRSPQENPWMSGPASIFAAHIPTMPKPDPLAPGPFSLADRSKVEEVLHAAGFRDISLTRLDSVMPLGPLHEAVPFLMNQGSAAAALSEVSERQRHTIVALLTDHMRQYETATGVTPPAAAWIVKAIR